MPSLEAQAILQLPYGNVFSYETTGETNLFSETLSAITYYESQKIALHFICSQFTTLSHLSKIALHNICCYSSSFLRRYGVALRSLCVYSPLFLREYRAALHSICVSRLRFLNNYKIALHSLSAYSSIYKRDYKIALHSLSIFLPLFDFIYKNALHFLLACEAKTSTFLVLTTLLCVPKAYMPTVFTFSLSLPMIIKPHIEVLTKYCIDLNLCPLRALSLMSALSLNLPALAEILLRSQFSIPLSFPQIPILRTILKYYILQSFIVRLGSSGHFSLLLPLSVHYSPLLSVSYKKFLLYLFYLERERKTEVEWYLCPFRFVCSLNFARELSFSFLDEFGLAFYTTLLLLRFPSAVGYYLYFYEQLMEPYFKYHKIYTIGWP